MLKFPNKKASGIINFIKIFFLAIIIIIICFQKIDFTYSVGVDSPLKWVFNYFFSSGSDIAKNIIFPHEPLAFFMYPLHENFVIYLIIKSILQILLVFGMFKLVNPKTNNEQILPLFFSLILIKILTFNLILFANLAIALLLYRETKNIFLKYYAFILTLFALYIKAYIGIISGATTAIFLLLEYFQTKKIKIIISDIAILIAGFVLIWLLLFSSFSGILNYFLGILNLASDNSAAAAFFPYNNWILLSLFIVIILILPLIQKSNKAIYFGLLFFGSLFGAWKHGMAREDIFHVFNFIRFIILLGILFIIYVEKNKLINSFLFLLAFSFLYINFSNAVNYNTIEKEYNGVNNFVEFVTDYNSVVENGVTVSKKNISVNRLNDTILQVIDNKTTDIYPWDYSIIPANNLNWQPRPVLHSYASYTKWLDEQNAKHFLSYKAPEFLIWHLLKNNNKNGETLLSLDNRYFLNDEPQTIIHLLSVYKIKFKSENFLVFQKREEPVKLSTKKSETQFTTFNKWIKIPNKNTDLIRIKAKISKNLFGNIKSFLYKDEQYYIRYKFDDGMVIKHRIVPKNIEFGLWINPYILTPENNYIGKRVESIFFEVSDLSLLKKKIEFEYEYIDYKDSMSNEENYINCFFDKNVKRIDSIIYKTINNFEEYSVGNWTPINPKNLYKDSLSNNTFLKIRSKTYSPVFSIKLNSLEKGKLLIYTDSQINSKSSKSNSKIVIEIKNEGVWHGEKVNTQIIQLKGWNHISNRIEYINNRENSESELKIYIFNSDKNELLLDDFRIIIKSIP